MTPLAKDQKPNVFVRSRKLLRYTIWMALFILGVIGVTGTLFYTNYVDHHPMSGLFLKKWIGMLVVFCFIAFLMIGFFVKWRRATMKATQPIVFDAEQITIGKDIIPFSKIERIKIIDIGRIFYERFYGATIYLLNGTSRFIAEQYYEEAPMLFQTLENIDQQHVNKNGYTGEKQQVNAETEQEEIFDFNVFTSIQHLLNLGLLIMALVGLFKFLFFNTEQPAYIIYFFLAVSIVAYYLNSRISYYFVVDKHQLEIRNKFLFGFLRVYPLNEIKGTLIHPHGMGRNIRFGMRIVTNDYQTFYYASNAFSKGKWRSLTQALQKRGIAVQNRLS